MLLVTHLKLLLVLLQNIMTRIYHSTLLVRIYVWGERERESDAPGTFIIKNIFFLLTYIQKKTVKALVDIGAYELALTLDGRTPADLARSRGHTEVANLLTTPPPDLVSCEGVSA